MMSWVTPEGRIQIAPATEERRKRLETLGYKHGDINVPHSNGETFTRREQEQAFAEVEFADMRREGRTMTPDERNSRFGGVVVPVAFMDVMDRS